MGTAGNPGLGAPGCPLSTGNCALAEKTQDRRTPLASTIFFLLIFLSCNFQQADAPVPSLENLASADALPPALGGEAFMSMETLLVMSRDDFVVAGTAIGATAIAGITATCARDTRTWPVWLALFATGTAIAAYAAWRAGVLAASSPWFFAVVGHAVYFLVDHAVDQEQLFARLRDKLDKDSCEPLAPKTPPELGGGGTPVKDIVPETIVPETIVLETIVPETIVPDTIVPDTIVPESIVDTPPCRRGAVPTYRPNRLWPSCGGPGARARGRLRLETLQPRHPLARTATRRPWPLDASSSRRLVRRYGEALRPQRAAARATWRAKRQASAASLTLQEGKCVVYRRRSSFYYLGVRFPPAPELAEVDSDVEDDDPDVLTAPSPLERQRGGYSREYSRVALVGTPPAVTYADDLPPLAQPPPAAAAELVETPPSPIFETPLSPTAFAFVPSSHYEVDEAAERVAQQAVDRARHAAAGIAAPLAPFDGRGPFVGRFTRRGPTNITNTTFFNTITDRATAFVAPARDRKFD